MEQIYRNLIANEFRNCVTKTIHRIQADDAKYRPFHASLLSDEAIFWSRFERSFSTSFGQRAVEEAARIAALSNGAIDAQRQVKTIVTLDEAIINAVSEHIQNLRTQNRENIICEDALVSILQTPLSGNTRSLRIISDLWWNKGGVDNFISLKTVMPNIDQTAVAKIDCLHLKLGIPNCNAYFGLHYNPYGENKSDYAFSPPMRIFDLWNDPVVLIGQEMWDTIGGIGCYNEIIEIAKQVGNETKSEIESIM